VQGSGEDAPRAVFPSVVGYLGSWRMLGEGGAYVGHETMSKQNNRRSRLFLKRPIQRGVVAEDNWGYVEELWEYAFRRVLHVDPEEHPVLLSDAPLNPKANRERMVSIMFEKFRTPAMYMAPQPVLSLFASGRTSGLVLESGESASHAVPIYEGHAEPPILPFDVAGHDLTEYMTRLLSERGYKLTSNLEREIVRDIKETLSFVTLDLDKELIRAAQSSEFEKKYELPDGQLINLDRELFMCPEALFRPSLIGKDCEGAHHLLHISATKCDIDMQKKLFGHIVLSGGNSRFEGLAARMESEIKQLARASMRVKVQASPMYSAWTGGSLLASLPSSQEMWVLKHEYEETGPQIVWRRCL